MEKFFSKIFSKYNSFGKGTKKTLAITGYGAVLLVALVVAIFTYRAPVVSNSSTTIQTFLDDSSTVALPTSTNAYIDQVSEANLALDVAEGANLSVANNVLEKSTSMAIRSEMSQTETEAVTKPIISITTNNDAVVNYVTVTGDNVPMLASQFGISEQTIKWANNLTSNTLSPGTNLVIPTVDGVVYTVKEGDTLASIVSKYGSSESQIMATNNIDNVKVGERIVIPGGNLPNSERPGYTAPVTSNVSYAGWYGNTAYAGNRYAYGYCTWYAYNRRVELGGRQIGSFWGNASSWDEAARSQGFVVNGTPVAGAIIQIDGGWGGAGHVGIVEGVRDDGMIVYSDMNGLAGWNRVGYSSWMIPPSHWEFIH